MERAFKSRAWQWTQVVGLIAWCLVRVERSRWCLVDILHSIHKASLMFNRMTSKYYLANVPFRQTECHVECHLHHLSRILNQMVEPLRYYVINNVAICVVSTWEISHKAGHGIITTFLSVVMVVSAPQMTL